MKTETKKMHRPVLWRMVMAHFNNKLIVYVNTRIEPGMARPNAVGSSAARTIGPRRDHSSSLNNCSTSGIVVDAPTATSVEPIARLCSAVSFPESNSAMASAEHCTLAGDETNLRNGDFVLFHVSFHSFTRNFNPSQMARPQAASRRFKFQKRR
jgi:hypothetical protein